MTEAEKAKAWRERLGLSPDQLADLTGYSRQSIYWYERGVVPPIAGKPDGQPTKPWVFKRYKMACLGAAALLHKGAQDWDWS